MITDNESAPTVAAKTAATPGKGAEPIIVDLDKKNRQAIRKLRKGHRGKLMRRIEKAKGAQPVIMMVRARPQRKSRQIAKLWGARVAFCRDV